MPGRKEPLEVRREGILRAAATVAIRDRLAGVTARAVAAEAGVSSGLIFFHFGSVEQLVVELLDWLLERTIVPSIDAEPLLPGDEPAARLIDAIRSDLARLPSQRHRLELFFEYWVMGSRHPEVRRTIRGALDRYRAALRPIAAAVTERYPDRYVGVSPEALAEVVASFVEGCAMQIVLEPDRFDVERSMTTLAALVRHPSAASQSIPLAL